MTGRCGKHRADCLDLGCPTHGTGMHNILYVYGTLRPGKNPTVEIEGQMFDLGWFPGVKLGWPGKIVCEPIEVTDWGPIDRYEGYMPSDPANSLYIRRPLLVPYGINGWIYEFNREVNPIKRVLSGDWLEYTGKDKGSHGEVFHASRV